jgi:hypothetical protein
VDRADLFGVFGVAVGAARRFARGFRRATQSGNCFCSFGPIKNKSYRHNRSTLFYAYAS